MKSSDENSTNNGLNGHPKTRLSVVSPPKKTASTNSTEAPKADPSKSGSSQCGSENGNANSTPDKGKKKLLKPPPEIDRQAEALKRLKVKADDLAKAPAITPLFRKASGGLNAVLKAMRFASQDDVIATFLEKYDSIPSGDRERLPWEAIALSAGLNLQHLTGSVLLALDAMSVSTVRMLAITAHPAVMKKRIQFAKLPSGEKDRNAIDQIRGLLASPKGPTFIGHVEVGRVPNRSDVEDDEPGPPQIQAAPIFTEDDDIDLLFPPASVVQDKLVPIRQRLLQKESDAHRVQPVAE